jgi:hypothetical protein
MLPLGAAFGGVSAGGIQLAPRSLAMPGRHTSLVNR